MGVLVFLNGQFVPDAEAVVPVSDRGFLLGDGLFETMRVVRGRPFRFAQHLERMARGAVFLKIKLPFTPKEMQEFAEQLIKQNQMPDSILRVTLTRGPGGRGYAPKAGRNPTLVMTLNAAPKAGAEWQWKLVTSSFRIPAADPLAPFKTTSKILHVMARIEATERGADEALLLNTDGDVAETASGNLFWVDDDQVCTAPERCGLLPGITRAEVLEICRNLGWPVTQRVTGPETLRKAKGIFVTQSVFGVVPVAALDGQAVPPSPRAAPIARAFAERLAQA
jgi:branched-chain amino acid aminotransferase